MEERLRFVARLLEGEAMTEVCREFGISRKTGYKIFDRYKEHGLEALSDRSRRPVRYAHQLPSQLESLIVRLKAEKPHWGARKIRELLVRRLDGDIRVPAKSTIHAVLDRNGLVKHGGRPRHRARGTPLSQGTTPNDLWCADFKGEFKLGNGRNCYPLTVTDHASRFLLLCEALDSTREAPAITAFERLFRERGLPIAIRSDNGVPFASPNALFNLSSSRSGGCVLASQSSASSQAIRSKMAVTNGCTSPSRKRQLGRPGQIASSNKTASMPSYKSSTASDRMRPSP
jgi:transposase